MTNSPDHLKQILESQRELAETLKEMLFQFEKKPSKKSIALCFSIIKRVDDLIGKKTWGNNNDGNNTESSPF